MDIRSKGSELVLCHDPFMPGILFKDWISFFRHKTLILNVKEDGLEKGLMDIMEKQGIDDYIFLDQSFPSLIKWAFRGETRCAVRVSEFESFDTALSLAGKIGWVWVDCFTHFPLSGKDAQRAKKAKFKLCLVSPELQGRNPKMGIASMAKTLREKNIQGDAVCTKRPDLWEKFFP